MALFNTVDAELYFSILPEVAVNTLNTLGAEFQKLRSQSPVVFLPNFDFVSDEGIPGAGHEFATQNCLVYTQPPAISIADLINDQLAGRLMLRSVGGAVVDATLTAPAYSHTAPMIAASNRQLPTFNGVARLAAADTLLAGLAVERFRLFQNRSDPPQYECDIVGTGRFNTPNGITGLPASFSVLNCLDGNATILQWTDAGGTRDFTAGEGFRSWSCEVVNNHRIPDRVANDPVNTLTYETVTVTAPYQRRILRGSRVVNATIQFPLQGTKPEWEKMVIGQEVTDVIFAARGGIITGAHRRQLRFTIPKARIANITTADDNGDAVCNLTLKPMYDSVSGGILTAQVINEVISAYR